MNNNDGNNIKVSVIILVSLFLRFTFAPPSLYFRSCHTLAILMSIGKSYLEAR